MLFWKWLSIIIYC